MKSRVSLQAHWTYFEVGPPCELRSIPARCLCRLVRLNSFICLIEIQAKNVFFRLFASAIGEIFVFSDDFKTAFLQHSYRPDVVRCCPGDNRPIYNKVEHPIERLSR